MQSVIAEVVKAIFTMEMARKLAKVALVGFATTVGSIWARRLMKDGPQPQRRLPPRRGP